MQPDGFGCRQEGVHRLLLDLAVPRVKLLFRFRNAGTVLIARSKHHRQVVAGLELRIFPKAEARSLFLLVTPFAVGVEQQVPAPGQELFSGIAVLVHNRGIGLAFLSRVFEVFVLLLEGLSPQLDPYVLHRLGDQLLDMEAIHHDRGAGKGLCHRPLPSRGHIHGHLGDGVPCAVRESCEHVGHLAGFRALDHCHKGSLFPMFRLVRERGPELAIRHGHLVDTQLEAEILWKEHPFFSMFVLGPVLAAAQGVFVLLFELLGLQLVGPRNGGE